MKIPTSHNYDTDFIRTNGEESNEKKNEKRVSFAVAYCTLLNKLGLIIHTNF